MQNHWYTVYTKLHCERKVALSLAKRNIENFCPFTQKKYKQLFRKIILNEPLFKSYVFVKTSEENIAKLSQEIGGVISLLYWKGHPATINEEEINAIKDFIKFHEDITVEKTKVFTENETSGTSYLMNGQILLVKNRIMKLTLPSLGLCLVSKYPEKENGIILREISFGSRDLMVQS